MTDEKNTCPYCKEAIKSDAIKCKHCHSKLAENRPAHEGVCPFCKEDVKPEAIKCKHCSSVIGTSNEARSPCSCSGSTVPFGNQPGLKDMFLAKARNGFPEPNTGQGCFWRCMDDGSFGHETCEWWCSISMPRNNDEWVLRR